VITEDLKNGIQSCKRTKPVDKHFVNKNGDNLSTALGPYFQNILRRSYEDLKSLQT